VKQESKKPSSRAKGGQGTRSKPRTAPRSGARRRQENAIVRYFRQTWAELNKVHWPTRQEATNLTLIVLAVTVAMSAFLGVVDWLSALFFSLLIGAPG
jgi:preprotein translocase subunit SecE